MTYSQRLSGGASLSDILHLELQIDQVKEERCAAIEELKRYEHERILFESDLQEEEAIVGTNEARALQKRLVDVQTHVDSLTTRLEELETALDELLD
ncbi:hypothetical protein AB4Z30_03935 [Paenibacillus sp. 2TAF8]|uniref:hypothetical protein n=1 Tax=Paenibacillus sp. 2TAF8 TaxID=3233020 RepID=UPI003F96A1C7